MAGVPPPAGRCGRRPAGSRVEPAAAPVIAGFPRRVRQEPPVTTTAQRTRILEELLQDLPQVHERALRGVHRTQTGCYRWITGHLPPRARTLETGLGLSTVLLARLGARHTCVTPDAEEVARLRDYCRAREIDLDRVTFHCGLSGEVLPTLSPGELDLVLIDGGHGFPTPVIDWFYGARHVRTGGVVVVDDLQVATPRLLAGVLDRDPRWRREAGRGKWAAFARGEGWDPDEPHGRQPFMEAVAPSRTAAQHLMTVAGRAHRWARLLRDRVARR